MSPIDPRYVPYGTVAPVTEERSSGMARMPNPVIVAMTLANATTWSRPLRPAPLKAPEPS